MRLVLVGPPGAGKGTQAVLLAERLDVPHISTGDLFRANLSEETPLGQEAKRYMDAGDLVPDSVTVDMVRERLTHDDAAKGFILDGFPRTLSQAAALADLLTERGEDVDAVVEFTVPEEELVARLLGRGRTDDTEDVIRRRQQVYRDETAPLLDHYRDRLVTVDAVGTVEQITDQVSDALRSGEERLVSGGRGGVRGMLARWRGRDIELKTPGELEAMRAAGALVARTLAAVINRTHPGVSTGELDALAEQTIRDAGAVPSFLGYHDYPASICASVNEQIVHGIPSATQVLADGDLISVDCGAILDGWHGDAAVTIPVGAVSLADLALSAACESALHAGIAAVLPGGRLSDISHAVQVAAQEAGRRDGVDYGIVAEYGGHGIGTSMHMDPFLPNFGDPGQGVRLVPGMALAVEPMLTAGDPATRELDDGWTVVTADGSRAVHWEHTVAITADGPRVLTVPFD